MWRTTLYSLVGLVFALGIAAAILLLPHWTQSWQSRVFDRLIATPLAAADPAVHLVELPRSGADGAPWSREDLARLLSAIDSRKPRVIGLDMVLSQGCDAAEGSALGRAIRDLDAPLVLGFLLSDTALAAPLGPALPIALMKDAPALRLRRWP